jgi:hypothetical protein
LSRSRRLVERDSERDKRFSVRALFAVVHLEPQGYLASSFLTPLYFTGVGGELI